MSLFQLPCESCKKIIQISTTQAGREVACPDCGNQQMAPKLGTIRNLQAVQSGTSGKLKQKKQWSAFQGSVFAFGFVVLSMGLIGGGTCFYEYSLRTAKLNEMNDAVGGETDFTVIEPFQAAAGMMDESRLWGEWKKALQVDLGPWQPTGFRFIKDERDGYWKWFLGYAITTGTGLLTLLTSFFLPNRR